MKWVGAIMVILGSGAGSFALVRSHRREEKALLQLRQIIERFERELSFGELPLSQLLRQVEPVGVGKVFAALANLLEENRYTQVADAMQEALKDDEPMPPRVEALLNLLSSSLGRYDLDGQLQSLSAVKAECTAQLTAHCENQEAKLRNYRTIGICAGLVLAILLL